MTASTVSLSGDDLNGVVLTADEAEILCGLDLSENEDALAYQRDCAGQLAELFKVTKDGVARDAHKAKKYASQATPEPEPEKPSVRTENIYYGLGFITSARLFFARVNRLKEFVGGIFKPLFKAFGLSYGLELLTDLSVVLYRTFKPSKEEVAEWRRLEAQHAAEDKELKFSYWQRFKALLKKDDRGYRMANAAAWFGTNLGLLFVTGGLSAILNTIVFSFDVVHEVIKRKFQVAPYEKLLNKINRRIAELADPESPKAFEGLASPSFSSQNFVSEADKAEINKLTLMKEKLEEKIKTVKSNRNKAIAVAVGILVGMLLFYFPPAGIALIATIGACTALGIGSVYAGFGQRCRNGLSALDKRFKISERCRNGFARFCNCFKKSPASVPVPVPAPSLPPANESKLAQQEARSRTSSTANVFGSLLLADELNPQATLSSDALRRKPEHDAVVPGAPVLLSTGIETFIDIRSSGKLSMLNEKNPDRYEGFMFSGTHAPNGARQKENPALSSSPIHTRTRQS